MVNHLNTSRFWNDTKNISLVVDSLELDFGFKQVNIMKDELFNANNVKVYAVPSSNYTLDSCFTLNLPKEIELKSISMTYLAEVNVYLHSPGQFFYVWRDEKNIISSSSKLIIKPHNTQVIWHDLRVNFMMERYIGFQDNNIVTYDDCVLNLPVDKSATITDYVVPSSVGSSANSSNLFGILPIDFFNIKHIYDALTHSNDYCSEPSETIKNKMIPAMMREKRNLKIEREFHNLDYVFTEDLELKEERNKPKAIFYIPRFSKK